MSNPNIPPPPFSTISDDVAEFNNVLAPLMGTGAEPQAQEWSIYTKIAAVNARWIDVIDRGNFNELNRFGQNLAADLTHEQALTVPRAFGIHLLVSLQAANNLSLGRGRYNEDRTAFFLTQFAGQLAMQASYEALNRSNRPLDLADALQEPASAIAEQTSLQGCEWTSVKLYMLAERLENRGVYASHLGQELPAQVDDLEAMRTHNDELLQELLRLQYNAVPLTPVSCGNSIWNISDTLSVQAQAMAMTSGRTSGITMRKWPFALLWACKQHADNARPVDVVITTEVSNSDSGIPRHVLPPPQLYMDKQGRLALDVFGSMALTRFYEEAGKPQNYETLRQFLLQTYFDIVVPNKVVKEVSRETARVLGSDPEEDRNNNITHHDLLVPRIRKLHGFRNRRQLDAIEAEA